jgi:hypothetical protein
MNLCSGFGVWAGNVELIDFFSFIKPAIALPSQLDTANE